MPKLHSSKHIQKVLEAHGFFIVSQKGSHVKLRTSGEQVLTVILPAGRKEMPYGTFRSILRQSKLTEEAFHEA